MKVFGYCRVSTDLQAREGVSLDEFYRSFGPRLPRTIATQLAETRRKFGA